MKNERRIRVSLWRRNAMCVGRNLKCACSGYNSLNEWPTSTYTLYVQITAGTITEGPAVGGHHVRAAQFHELIAKVSRTGFKQYAKQFRSREKNRNSGRFEVSSRKYFVELCCRATHEVFTCAQKILEKVRLASETGLRIQNLMDQSLRPGRPSVISDSSYQISTDVIILPEYVFVFHVIFVTACITLFQAVQSVR